MTLTVQGVSAGYQGASVVHDAALEVQRGERVALLGANGAGKSTLLSVLAGSLRSERGAIRLGDKDIGSLRPHRVAEAGVRWVGDPRPLYSEMSVDDNLRIGGFTTGRAVGDRLRRVYDRFPELAERRQVRAGALSGGQAQMLAIAQALMSDPLIVLLDEPSIGLSVAILDRLGEIVDELASEGVAVLWSEQFPDLVLRHCDSVVLMIRGHCRPKVPVAELTSAELEDAYFGSGRAAKTTA